MKQGSFGVYVKEGCEKDSGYVEMEHGKQYTVTLENFFLDRAADAQLLIDGKEIATYRLNAGQVWSIERKPDDNGRFTFYVSGTTEASKAAISAGDSNNGLIQVVFTPEVYKPRVRTYSNATSEHNTFSYSCRSSRHDCLESVQSYSGEVHQYVNSNPRLCMTKSAVPTASYKEGATGLSGHSNQRFASANEIEKDESGKVTISLRIVGTDNGPRPLTSTGCSCCNPVPPPVA